mmetsp:Transcript_4937/g.8151  ORF Transcript_4937/g.8151 Transcript_4937/m.8151 type:complete len:125 (-) Transcript_4937:182-556(-)|eukprot:CAMPEP_0114430246 /NCGR_PEP_ID=MMETSP0103-20121206/9936_1 /TAXON_ID=37642 ORGANISM="Paraphysomonas imperforata, Strain PA2" /NCGR_SAMPLE_ID=MMETSP0103 /ASSEMBLY_ACC=CAM_ASM_000201 /LENGTH=124 /DNA_ID=CAMNT_0001599675 /DNA_START=27 /DNA_END=401 /DNA_ORIENTATION=-
MAEEEERDPTDYYADIPVDFKGLRCCLRCSLLKSYEQFYENGCENCAFLNLGQSKRNIDQCTSTYFEGVISMLDPRGSWVARWQRIDNCVPGMYAVEVIGELPQDIIDLCVENDYPYRSQKNTA